MVTISECPSRSVSGFGKGPPARRAPRKPRVPPPTPPSRETQGEGPPPDALRSTRRARRSTDGAGSPSPGSGAAAPGLRARGPSDLRRSDGATRGAPPPRPRAGWRSGRHGAPSASGGPSWRWPQLRPAGRRPFRKGPETERAGPRGAVRGTPGRRAHYFAVGFWNTRGSGIGWRPPRRRALRDAPQRCAHPDAVRSSVQV